MIGEEKYVLKLFVTGMSVASVRAIRNIKLICESHIKNGYELDIIDINRNPEVLQKFNIIACPTLLKVSPSPSKRLIGDLSDESKVLTGLGLNNH